MSTVQVNDTTIKFTRTRKTRGPLKGVRGTKLIDKACDQYEQREQREQRDSAKHANNIIRAKSLKGLRRVRFIDDESTIEQEFDEPIISPELEAAIKNIPSDIIACIPFLVS
jgi:hypothetical protein